MKKKVNKLFSLVISLVLLMGLSNCKIAGEILDNVKLTKIILNTDDVKKEYEVGDSFSTDGLIVTAVYLDGTTKEIEEDCWEATGFDSREPEEEQEITVTYTEGFITAKETYTISIKEKYNSVYNYKIEHYQQNISNDEYTLVDTENKEGDVGEYTEATARNYEGFTSKTFTQKKITSDGSTVVKIYYDRNTYTITYETVYGTAPESKTVRYGYILTYEDLPILTQAGYEFAGWNKKTGDKITSATTITAIWNAADDISYKVEHYKQNIENDEYTLADTENRAGKTATKTSAKTKTYEGFTAKTFTQETIAADGSTVVKIYYDRNTYTITYETAYGTAPEAKTVKYGYTLTAEDLPTITQTGYEFGGWNVTVGTVVTEATTITAIWNVTTNTAYKVEHYQQNVSDNEYTLVDTDNKTGTTATETAATSKTYTGFAVKAYDQEIIAADGTTVVKIYYDRNVYTVSYSSVYGTTPNPKTVKYGYTLTAEDLPALTEAGYEFGGWNVMAGTVVTEAATITAIWAPAANTAYKVEHYQQNVSDNDYTLISEDTDSKTGTTGTETTAVSKTYTGFSAKTFTQETIAADGTTVVKIYYDRNTYTITYETAYGTAPESKTVKYGYTLTAEDLPALTETDYEFGGWNVTVGTVVTEATTITANWIKVETAFDITIDSGNSIAMDFYTQNDVSQNLKKLTFVVPQEYETYKWYLDGTLQSEVTTNQYTITTNATTSTENYMYSNGIHEVLIITMDSYGEYNSAKATFIIDNASL